MNIKEACECAIVAIKERASVEDRGFLEQVRS